MWGGRGKFLVEVWRGGKVLMAQERAPLQKGAPFAKRAFPCGGGRALVAYLIGRGSSPSRRFGDFLLFFHAAKS